MSIGFENSIIDAFSNLNTEIFKVNQTHHRLFICGGEVNHGCCIPPSFRHRFLEYIDLENVCRNEPDELLIEINQYNKNPSKEMQKLRDFYITLLKSKPI